MHVLEKNGRRRTPWCGRKRSSPTAKPQINDADDDEEDKDDTNNTSNKQHSKMRSDHWQQREREQWEQQGKRSRSRSRNDK